MEKSANSIREIAWQGVGTTLPANVKSKNIASACIAYAGLDYNVSTARISARIDGRYSTVRGKVATYREDSEKIFGIVSDKYKVVQNMEAFSFFDNITMSGQAEYVSSGSINQGQKVFICAKLPYLQYNVKGDLIEIYLVLSCSHDGKSAVRASLTPIRVYCMNTLNYALRAGITVRVEHRGDMKKQRKDAERVIMAATELTAKSNAFFNAAANYRVSNQLAERFLSSVIAKSDGALISPTSARQANIVDTIRLYDATHITQQTEATSGTLFGLINAVSGYYQNWMDYGNEEKRMRSILYGTAASRTNDAIELSKKILTGYDF